MAKGKEVNFDRWILLAQNLFLRHRLWSKSKLERLHLKRTYDPVWWRLVMAPNSGFKMLD